MAINLFNLIFRHRRQQLISNHKVIINILLTRSLRNKSLNSACVRSVVSVRDELGSSSYFLLYLENI